MTELQRKVEQIERELANTKAELSGKQAACIHQFGEPIYNPIIEKGYTIAPRTPQNYDDIPYAQGYTVEDKITPRWTRTCPLCGKVEHTHQTNSHTTVTPKFS
jgi:hypothetical protein